MRIIYITALALLTLGIASCGSRKEEPVDAESVPVEDVIDSTDSAETFNMEEAFAALDSEDPEEIQNSVEAIAEQIGDLYENGEQSTANKYLDRLKKWYKKNKKSLKKHDIDTDRIRRVISKASDLREQFADDAEDMREEVEEAAEDIRKEYEEAAANHEEVRKTTEEVSEKAKNAVEKAKSAAEKAKSAAEKAKSAAEKAKSTAE